jgi:hypothetical protein
MKNRIVRLSLPVIALVAVLSGILLGGVGAYAQLNQFTLSDGDNYIYSNHSDNIFGIYYYYYWENIPINANGNYFYVSYVLNSNGTSNHHDTTKYGMAYIWAQPGTTLSIYNFWAYTVYGNQLQATVNQGWNITSQYPLTIQQNLYDGTDPLAIDYTVAHR